MWFLCKILVFPPITSIRPALSFSLSQSTYGSTRLPNWCLSLRSVPFRPKTTSKLTTHGDDATGNAVSNKRGSSYCNCLTKLRLYVSKPTHAHRHRSTPIGCIASRHNGRFAMETLCLHTQKAIDGQNGYQIIFRYFRIGNVLIVMSCK